MALPADYQTCRVTGRYVDLLGVPASGSVTFSATPLRITSPATETIVLPAPVTVPLDPGGEIDVTLPATDDPDITPQGFTYQVTERLATSVPGGQMVTQRPYSIEAPVGGDIDLSTVLHINPGTGASITKGDKGDPGPPLVPAGSVATFTELPETGDEIGELWTTADDGHGWSWNGTVWIDLGQWRGQNGSGLANATGIATYDPGTQTIHVPMPTAAQVGAPTVAEVSYAVGVEASARSNADSDLQGQIDALPDQFVPRPGNLASLPTPTIIAHRGGAGPAPENTLEAMRISSAAGVDALEFDVQPLGDGSIGLMHDSTVDRTTDGTGAVSDYSAAAWMALDAAADVSWPRVVPPPLLAQVLAEFGGDRVLVIEPKDAASVTGLCDALDRYQLAGSVVLQAASAPVLSAIKGRGYRAYYYWSTEPTSGNISTAISGGADYLGGNGVSFSDAKVSELVATGKPVWMWTINRRHRATALVGLGVAGIMTDEPTYIGRATAIRTVDSWRLGGLRGYGINAYPETPAPAFTTAGEMVLSAGGYQIVCIGEVSPMSMTSTRVIDVDCSFDTVSGTGALLVMTGPDDLNYSTVAGQGGQSPNGWMAYLRQSGAMSLFKHTAPTTSTSVSGNITTAALTGGGWAHLRLTISSTQVTVTRTDSAGTYTATDSAHRGGYVFLGKKDTSAVARFRNLTIT